MRETYIRRTVPNDQLSSTQSITHQDAPLQPAGREGGQRITLLKQMPAVPTTELREAMKRRKFPYFGNTVSATYHIDTIARKTDVTGMAIKAVPAAENAQAKKERPRGRHSLKRKFASAVISTALTMGGIGEVNHVITQTIWPASQAQVIELNQDTPPGLEHSGIAVFAGLGQPDSIKQSEALEPSLKEKFGHVFAIVYPNGGIDENALAQSLNDAISQYHLKVLSLYGLSTGSVIETHILPKLDLESNGGVELSAIIEESPPVTPDTISNGNYVLAELLYKFGIHDVGGFLGKSIGEAYTYIYHNTDPKVGMNFQIKNAYDHTVGGVSPAQWGSELHEAAVNSEYTMAKDLASVYGYKLYLIRAKDPAADPTVNMQLAQKELEKINNEAARMRGNNRRGSSIGDTTTTPLIVLAVPITHADPIQQPDVHNEVISKHVAGPKG